MKTWGMVGGGWGWGWGILVLGARCWGGSGMAGILAGPFMSPVNGHAYYLLEEGSWQDAEVFAMRWGGHLATVRSAEEQAWVFQRLGAWGGSFRSLWIGLRRVSPGGAFAWASGEELSYTHWLPGQPDDSPVTQGEGYVHMLNTGNAYGHPGGYWNDLASPNGVFATFNPVCGVVEIVPTGVPGVQLTMASDPEGMRVTATTPGTTVRVVWEMTRSLSLPSWSVVDVQSDGAGRATWSRRVPAEFGAGFHRVRAHDLPGFNGRLDHVIRRVRIAHPDAVLVEASPVLLGWVTGMPDAAALRAVFRVAGSTLVAEQEDPWASPSVRFEEVTGSGDLELAWPVAMSLEEAESALRDAGYGREYEGVTLCWRMGPGMTEPAFVFGTRAHGLVWVGTTTRKVVAGR